MHLLILIITRIWNQKVSRKVRRWTAFCPHVTSLHGIYENYKNKFFPCWDSSQTSALSQEREGLTPNSTVEAPDNPISQNVNAEDATSSESASMHQTWTQKIHFRFSTNSDPRIDMLKGATEEHKTSLASSKIQKNPGGNNVEGPVTTIIINILILHGQKSKSTNPSFMRQRIHLSACSCRSYLL